MKILRLMDLLFINSSCYDELIITFLQLWLQTFYAPAYTHTFDLQKRQNAQ